jgi:hypothetical protein
MRDARKGKAYDAESDAIEGTLLAERPGYNALHDETVALMESAYWRSLVGAHRAEVKIEAIQSNSMDGDADYWLRQVRYRHGAVRSVVTHEMAHVATGLLMGDEDFQAHGPEWRGLFVDLTSALYGPQYGQVLLTGFADRNLAVATKVRSHVLLRRQAAPIIDLDAVYGTVRGGWTPPWVK